MAKLWTILISSVMSASAKTYMKQEVDLDEGWTPHVLGEHLGLK